MIWQDPPPGVEAPSQMHVALIVSAGPPRVPVPDVTGLDALLASKLITAAGLTVILDKCVKMEHGRYHGGLHSAGMNTEIMWDRTGVLEKSGENVQAVGRATVPPQTQSAVDERRV